MKTPRFLASMSRWIDSSAAAEAVENPEDQRVDWVRALPFFGLHLTCLAVFKVGWSWTAVAVCLAMYFVRMFAVTGFYHRYFSHRSFRTSRAGQALLAVWGSAAVQRGPLWWAAHHRLHHLRSDQPPDVHSPVQHGFLWSHVGWILSRANFPTNLKIVADLARYPELKFLDRYDTLVPFLLAVSLLGLGGLLQAVAPGLGTNAWQMLVWGFFVSTILLFHGTGTINSLAHQLGSKRFKTTDESRNNFFLALITLGEGWHNNHHHYPQASRMGFYWWEIDLTYYGLLALEKLGLIWDLKQVPDDVLEEGLLDAPEAPAPVPGTAVPAASAVAQPVREPAQVVG
ncbi:MAG: acyl-CoA desaturase [Planctomycetes bacterium]|nr:acyl-CoA desaturase [Planctomycetota bacterium]